ncbi:RNA-directed DNA polymerase from mobile element jockey-like [Brachionus plicatilis]|uniref:RNA-directed DNA polymerase from mobile element jockey-like n=1 Tax=Brachionus plicatilis TaxID=10195 RepID=A0A3M7Q1S9_BRAPC|nr:RNA-directed DNA polymerase from mobile element jockey-like [Brachionus plicatilis]
MRRATKVPGRLRDLNYVERCKKLGLTSLKARRLSDLIQQFKIAKGIEHVEFAAPTSISAPRGKRRARLRRELVKNCNQRHNFFCNQIVNDWNDLKDSIITAKSTNDFKSKLDKTAT